MNIDDFNENTEYEDTTEALLEKYDTRRASKPEDVIAMQAVLCILLALLLIGANFFYPDTAEALYSKLCSLTSDTADIIPNPIDLIILYCDKL